MTGGIAVRRTPDPTLSIPDRLPLPLSESYPEVVTAYWPHRLGLGNGVPVNPHAYLLEVGPGALRACKRTTRPVGEWSELGPEDEHPSDELPLTMDPTLRAFVVMVTYTVLAFRRPHRHISEWSTQSKRNMVRTFAVLDWKPFLERGIPEMVTLTYPGGDWRQWAPDGRAIKAHLKAFKLRYRRKFGENPSGVWKLEFQSRGAPHFHIYLNRPTTLPVYEFMSWVSTAWYDIVGSGDPRHLRAGTGVDRQFAARHGDIRTLVTYFTKHSFKNGADKRFQNDVPAGFEDVGRFWGVWGLHQDIERVELTRDDYVQVVRVLRRLQRAARRDGRKIPAQGGEAGLWTLCGNGWHLGTQLARWLRGPPEPCASMRKGLVTTSVEG